jgi:chaperonin GroES
MNEVAQRVIPNGGTLIVEMVAKENVTKSGIILPDSAQQNTVVGRVLACGTGVTGIEDGDRVIFHERAGTKIVVGDNEWVVVPASSVLAFIQG